MINVKRGSVSQKKSPTMDLPENIKVNRSLVGLHTIPGSVFSCTPFRWRPQAFALESERLNEKIIDASVQDDSLLRFMENTSKPLIYGVAGNPDESKARYFAAYLASLHARDNQNSKIIWHNVYGGYNNDLIKEYQDTDSMYEPTMIVLCNLNIQSTNHKLEKAKDILERFDNIPRVVVCAGEDPISFLSTRLYSPINCMAYFSESLVKKKVEVI